MGSGRTLRNLSQVRPIKGDRERRRRQKVQRRRLIALGMDAAIVEKMNPRKVMDLLKYPVKVKAQVAKALAKPAAAKPAAAKAKPAAEKATPKAKPAAKKAAAK